MSGLEAGGASARQVEGYRCVCAAPPAALGNPTGGRRQSAGSARRTQLACYVTPALRANPRCRDRYWSGEDDGREPLLPRSRGEPVPIGGPAGGSGGSPRGAGYHTPPSRFQACQGREAGFGWQGAKMCQTPAGRPERPLPCFRSAWLPAHPIPTQAPCPPLQSPYQSPIRGVPAGGPLVTGFPPAPPVTIAAS